VSIRNCLLAAVVLAVSAPAQEPLTANVKGRLRAGNEPVVHGYLIELNNLATHATIDRIEVAADGEWSARHVPFGDYLVRVTTYHGDTIAQSFVSVNQQIAPVELHLPAPPASPSGGTVSLRELRNPPRRQAVDLSEAAQRFAGSGRFDRAASELEKAVRISPDYAAAHSNLAVQYLRLGKNREAEAEVRLAMEIAGPNVQDLSNLAFAQLSQERFGEAKASAQAALKLAKGHAPAHLVLGLTLVLEPETRGEGMAHLEAAAKTLESARRAIAALSAKR
jgi:tetratricopeptide (TPR) repeat protein